jgi:3-oxoacyl-[acyl-carrier protein] reductase
MKLGLEGKRAVVLGASKGLGAVIAQTLAAEGATVTEPNCQLGSTS